MALLDHDPDGGLEDEDEEDKEAANHVEAADQAKKHLKLINQIFFSPCGLSYKASTIVMYDSRVVPDLKIPHITTLES